MLKAIGLAVNRYVAMLMRGENQIFYFAAGPVPKKKVVNVRYAQFPTFSENP